MIATFSFRRVPAYTIKYDFNNKQNFRQTLYPDKQISFECFNIKRPALDHQISKQPVPWKDIETPDMANYQSNVYFWKKNLDYFNDKRLFLVDDESYFGSI